MSRTHRAVVRLALGTLTAVAVVAGAQTALAGAPAADLSTDLTVMTALSAGPTHVDPLPDGVRLDDPTDTASLYARAGLDRARAARHTRAALGRARGSARLTTAAATAPAGPPSTAGLGAHVVPSCTGSGTDGKRVQPLFVREATTGSRYTAVLPLLLNEVANVDDVFAVSAAKTGGVRRVRWVHDGCVPVLPEVVLPAGSLGSFGATIRALEAQGYTDPNRKYLVFADAQVLCGVGTLYNDVRSTDNLNDSRTSYARVDSPCWSASTSIPAHELIHNLGGVLPGAPHGTANGHCWDESDLMCYADGSGVPMQPVCPSSNDDQLLDCGNDDYFSTAPSAGTWLAQYWNTASSGFLDTTAPDPAVTPTTAPTPPTTASTPRAPSAEPSSELQRTKVEGEWRARRRLVVGRLRVAGHELKVAGETLVLQRRDRGGSWRAVDRETTDRSGRVAERHRPRRGTVYRWIYDGNDQLHGSHSGRIKVVG